MPSDFGATVWSNNKVDIRVYVIIIVMHLLLSVYGSAVSRRTVGMQFQFLHLALCSMCDQAL